MRHIVDASNVMGARPDGWWRDRPAALVRLLDEVQRWRVHAPGPVVFVLDPPETPRLPPGDRNGVEVVYGARSADDRIAELAGRGDVVVTSDRGLRARVVALGATVEGAGGFRVTLADIPERVADRELLARFGAREADLLGRGGEARVFACGDDRVVRLPHPGVQAAALEHRRRFLDALPATFADDVALPRVLDHVEVGDRLVVLEARLPGRNGIDVLTDRVADRAALVAHHLDVSNAVATLPCDAGAPFGELWGEHAIRSATFAEWSIQRLAASLAVAGPELAHVDPVAVTADVVAALDTSQRVLVHLDAFLGNMLADRSRVTALLDFGPMTIIGPPGFDPLVSVAYLDTAITPTATEADRSTARRWADSVGLGHAVEPVRRWIATYWTGAPDDVRLTEWCRSILCSAAGS